jgi:hypothetical protein
VGVCYDADAQCRAAHRVGQGFTWAKAENRVSAAAAAASAAAAGYQAAAAGLVAAAARGPMVASVGVLHTFRHQVSGVSTRPVVAGRGRFCGRRLFAAE